MYTYLIVLVLLCLFVYLCIHSTRFMVNKVIQCVLSVLFQCRCQSPRKFI